MIGGVERSGGIAGGRGGHTQTGPLNVIAQRDVAVAGKAAQSIG